MHSFPGMWGATRISRSMKFIPARVVKLYPQLRTTPTWQQHNDKPLGRGDISRILDVCESASSAGQRPRAGRTPASQTVATSGDLRRSSSSNTQLVQR